MYIHETTSGSSGSAEYTVTLTASIHKAKDTAIARDMFNAFANHYRLEINISRWSKRRVTANCIAGKMVLLISYYSSRGELDYQEHGRAREDAQSIRTHFERLCIDLM